MCNFMDCNYTWLLQNIIKYLWIVLHSTFLNGCLVLHTNPIVTSGIINEWIAT